MRSMPPTLPRTLFSRQLQNHPSSPSPDGLHELLVHHLAAPLGAGPAHQQQQPRGAGARGQAAARQRGRHLHVAGL